ncbi:MAG: methylmalonyl-CoA mutase subunit beta [Gracilimonas sp.]|uniref:methylmalonyl-CoA mutase subunit beta n=1 Tax=Gracilimonas TaxID=649462 RepID=UPI001B1B03EB|nr:methylmalonyl-CoA mutase subunit beta [Gracilimonas sp.]MBO6584577.1 methylmalonyl-CoA mutase subunit beta [Gracilimonas sp.]MBO6616152.1 methylmalonyl-CoA mutase subunit beta [Gracilimonas sp.]
MENSDFEKALHFDEFPPISTEEWEAVIEKDLKGKDYKDVLRWQSGEGVNPLPFYREENVRDLSLSPETVAAHGSWNVIEPVESSAVSEANKEALHALENGASGLYFCPPKNYLQSREDLENLLKDIQIELIALRFGSAISSTDASVWLKEICDERKLNTEELSAGFNFDPMANGALTGNLVSKAEIKNTVNTFDESFSFCAIDSSVFANAGATIIQQLAFSMAAGNEYLGFNSKLAGNMHFNFATGPNYFLEIAKFRAFKRMWGQVLGEYGVDITQPSVHAETNFWNKSQSDAHNNMLRTTTEAMSAAIGGCDTITVHRYDEHFSDDSGFASRIARNIQLILQEEAYLDKVADPGAGSYYIEVLTDSMAQKSWVLFQEIEAKGGFHEALKSGYIQELVAASRKEKIEAYQQKEKVLVGVNKYKPDEKIQNLEFKIQNFASFDQDMNECITIDKISLLNIEAELKNGEG